MVLDTGRRVVAESGILSWPDTRSDAGGPDAGNSRLGGAPRGHSRAGPVTVGFRGPVEYSGNGRRELGLEAPGGCAHSAAGSRVSPFEYGFRPGLAMILRACGPRLSGIACGDPR